MFMTIAHSTRISPRLHHDPPPSVRFIAISLAVLLATLLDIKLEDVGCSVGLSLLWSPAGRALMQ